MIWNLLSNAIKFSPRDAMIRLDLRPRGSVVEIAVIDHGCGIDPEFLPRVFDRFTQASGASTSPGGGLGLGLAIVRHIVELHGGTVVAESEGEQEGTCFTVRLPVESAVRPVPAMSAGEVDRATRARVTTSDSTDAALAALERERPDVLISDIEMPGGDGYQMIRALRLREEATDGRIPAIALTGTTRAEDRVRMLSAGFQLHVSKPVDPAELVAAVAALVSREAVRL